MDVFLVPAGHDHYELYTEEPDDEPQPEELPPPPASGIWARSKYRVIALFFKLKFKFQRVLAEAERERRRGVAARENDGRWARIKGAVMRWIAESIAEQRLLWNLRRTDSASFLYPDDLSEADAVAVLRKQLAKDFDKHQIGRAH